MVSSKKRDSSPHKIGWNDPDADNQACKSYYINDFGFEATSAKLEENLQEGNDAEDKIEEKKLKETSKKKKDIVREDSEMARTVCVTNVNIKTEKKSLLHIFKKFGKVESIRYRNCPIQNFEKNKKGQILKDKFDPKRTSMTAYVKYGSEAMAGAALVANNTEVIGHHIQVSAGVAVPEHVRRKKLAKGCTIIVGNLPYVAEEEPLYRLLSGCGEVANIHIIRYKTMAKGTAFVEFGSQQAAAEAIKLDGTTCMARPLRISKAVRRAKKSKNLENKNLDNKGNKNFNNQGTNKNNSGGHTNSGSNNKNNWGSFTHNNKNNQQRFPGNSEKNRKPMSEKVAKIHSRIASSQRPQQAKRLQKYAASGNKLGKGGKRTSKDEAGNAAPSPSLAKGNGSFAGQKSDRIPGSAKRKRNSLNKEERRKNILAKKLNCKRKDNKATT